MFKNPLSLEQSVLHNWLHNARIMLKVWVHAFSIKHIGHGTAIASFDFCDRFQEVPCYRSQSFRHISALLIQRLEYNIYIDYTYNDEINTLLFFIHLVNQKHSAAPY